jgi:hypothetical protein
MGDWRKAGAPVELSAKPWPTSGLFLCTIDDSIGPNPVPCEPSELGYDGN